MPNINCTEFSRLLAEAVESHQSVASAVLREHAAQCSDCRALWLDALLVDRAVAQWKNAVPAVDLADSVLFHLAAQELAGSASAGPALAGQSLTTSLPKTRRRLQRRTLVSMIASCAAVCIAIFMARLGRPTQSPRPATQQLVTKQPTTGQPVQMQSATAKTVSKQPAGREPIASPGVSILTGERSITKSTGENARVDLLVRDASSAYLNLANEAAEAVTAVTVLVPPPDSSDAPLNADASEERWVDEVQRELAPVTRQLGQAFEFLIHAVPAEKTPAT